jgi:putative sterol carrier protein
MSAGRTDPRISLFMRAVDFASQRAPIIDGLRRANQDVHLCLEGRGGGDFTLSIRDGRVRALAGVPRPPTTIVTMHKSLFLDLIAGRIEASTAELTGKIRVQGAPMASLMIAGMVSMFRKQTERSDAAGKVARVFLRWIERTPEHSGS